MDEDTRFRRALKSPLTMVGLCLLAGFAVYHNIFKTTMETGMPTSVASISSPEDPTSTSPKLSLVKLDEDATKQIGKPLRDPFSPMSAVELANSSFKQSSTFEPSVKPDDPSSTRLTLKAIAIESEHRSAVINRQVVHEGEIINGHRIVSIQLKGVWVKHHGKKEFLTFARNTTS